MEYCNKARLERKFQHEILYEVRKVKQTTGVKNRFVKFLADSGFISNTASRAVVLYPVFALHMMEVIYCGLT
jgi:protein-disulfide isomerase-like protein with CxxC motif